MKKFTWIILFTIISCSLLADSKNKEGLSIPNLSDQQEPLKKIKSEAFSYRDLQIMYASAHAFGAAAIGSTTIVGTIGGLMVGTIAGLRSQNILLPIAGAIMGGGTPLALGLITTNSLGGSTEAILAGCVSGVSTLIIGSSLCNKKTVRYLPAACILTTMAKSATVASWKY